MNDRGRFKSDDPNDGPAARGVVRGDDPSSSFIDRQPAFGCMALVLLLVGDVHVAPGGARVAPSSHIPAGASGDEGEPTVQDSVDARSCERVDDGKSLDDLKRDLRAPYPDARRRAVRALVEQGSEDAWDLVLDALEDRDGQVADTAQLALENLRDPRRWRELLGSRGLRHKDDWVRRRVAEAVGRSPLVVDGERLARALDRRDPRVSRLLLWSLERLADAGRLDGDEEAWATLAKRIDGELGRGREAAVRASALVAAAALDPAHGERLARRHRHDPDADVRAASLEVAHRLALPERSEWIASALYDEAPSVRAVALQQAARAPGRALLMALVEQLGVEPRAVLRARIVDVLRGATGFRHRADARAWRAVVERVPTDWDGTPLVDRSTPKKEGEARSRTSLARLDPASDRFAVCIDFSGSLWNDRGGGVTRKALLDPQFAALVERLPRDVRFNVVPYTKDPHPWHDSLVDASPRNVKDARRAFTKWSMRGQGDAYGALQVALADVEVDRILLLTDGAPTGGRHWDLELMIELLLEETRYRGVVIDVVLIDATRSAARRWARLPESTGGRLLSVEFDAQESPARNG